MTDAVVGTGGRNGAGPRTGPHARSGPQSRPRSRPGHEDGGSDESGPSGTASWRQRLHRLYLAFIAVGAALSLIAVGMGAQRYLDQVPAAVVSAPADPQAGNLIDRSLSSAQAGPSAKAAATSGPQPAVPGIAIPGADPPSLVAGDAHAAAAIAIHIPRLHLNRSLVGLHILPDQSLSVPQSFADVGWWNDGPHPGAPGAMVVAGHVSSRSGPAVFWALKDLRPGDRITVDRADHSSATFQIVGKASYPRSSFPDDVVYRTSGKPSLHLVTCDGAFNPAIGHHQDNLIVFADLVPAKHRASHSPTAHRPAHHAAQRAAHRQHRATPPAKPARAHPRPRPTSTTPPSSQPTPGTSATQPYVPVLTCTSDLVCHSATRGTHP